MSNKKLIGLTGPSSFTTECVRMIEQYFKANLIMLYHSNQENLDYWISKCDAIILAGGVDIHPTVYNQCVKNGNGLNKFDLERDFRELYVIKHCLDRRLPMLGICRGHQLIGLCYGLQFMMDISNTPVVHTPHKSNIVTIKNEPIHYIDIINSLRFKSECQPERSIISKVFERKESKRIWVNSFHHQALYYDGKTEKRQDDLEILGISPVQFDKPINIIELMRGPNWISCQFHPEYDWDVNIPSRTVLEIFKEMMEGK